MATKTWIKALFAPKPAGTIRRAPDNRARLGVEQFGDRIVPAVVLSGTVLDISTGDYGANVRVTEADGIVRVTNWGGEVGAVWAHDATAIVYHGGNGPDSFENATSLTSTAYTGGGNDTLKGNHTSGAGNVFYGGTGNDTLTGGGGVDWLYGEWDNDRVRGDDSGDYISGGDGNDTLGGDWWYGQQAGEGGNDTIFGGSGNDTMRGSGGDDWLVGEAGDDVMAGWSGSDTYTFNADWSQGSDTVDERNLDGTDTIDYSFGARQGVTVNLMRYTQVANGNSTLNLTFLGQIERAVGSGAADTLTGYYGQNWNPATPAVVEGGAGNDTLYGSSGNDSLYGGDGNDSIFGGAGNDYLDGGAGNDYLGCYILQAKDGFGGHNGIGVPTVWDEPGNDTLSGGSGDDTVRGGTGNDWAFGGAGNDVVGAGLYTTDCNSDYSWVQREVYGEDGNDRLFGDDGNDTLMGGYGNDTMYGGSGNDQLGAVSRLASHSGGGLQQYEEQGEPGDDDLYGGSGSDTLSGGDGRDLMYGGGQNPNAGVVAANIVLDAVFQGAFYYTAGSDWLIDDDGSHAFDNYVNERA